MKRSSIEIIERGLVFRGIPTTPEQSATFPAATVLSDGRWLCAWRSSPRKECCVEETVFYAYSDDGGHAWSTPRLLVESFSVDGVRGSIRAGAFTDLGEGRVIAVIGWVDQSLPESPFFDPETHCLKNMRIFLLRSEDRGETWSTPEPVPSVPATSAVPITGPVLLLANGQWACQYETNKPYGSDEVWSHTSRMIFSDDEGQSWSGSVKVTGDEANRFFWWDQRPGVGIDGELLDLLWTFDNKASCYLNIHAVSSRDHGQTWTQPRDIGVSGQPAQPVNLPDGRWLMVWIDRDGAPTIKARISEDGGVTWRADSEVVIESPRAPSQTIPKHSMNDAWAEMQAFSIGFPGTASCGNGDVLVTYYKGESTDSTGIEWVRLRVV